MGPRPLFVRIIQIVLWMLLSLSRLFRARFPLTLYAELREDSENVKEYGEGYNCQWEGNIEHAYQTKFSRGLKEVNDSETCSDYETEGSCWGESG